MKWILALSLFVLCQCATVHHSTTDSSFQKLYGEDFTYCEIKSVQQSEQKTCGLAALESVFDYWDISQTEAQLKQKYPPNSRHGYLLTQLKQIAEKEGLLAFAISLERDSLEELENHLRKGRPIITTIRCPNGPYFGKPIPVIESWDWQSVRHTGNRFLKKWKSHYVLVFGFSDEEFLLMDPAYGMVRMHKLRFLPFWRKENFTALICAPKQG